jgi:hypothetical protein
MPRLPQLALLTFVFCGITVALSAQEQPVTSETAPIATPASPNQPTAGPDEKEKLPPKGVIHVLEVKDPPKVHADQPCNNYSWAASLAGVLASQKADIAEDYWIDKYYGGDLCLESMGTPDDLIKKAEGEYVLDDGRHVELKLEYFAGLPANSSTLLVPIMTDEILILFIDGHADMLIGAMWDEYQSKRGERMIDLKELHLLDPLLDGEKQKVILDTTGDDISKVTGFMKVTATEVHQQYWPK